LTPRDILSSDRLFDNVGIDSHCELTFGKVFADGGR
jgi:hypothetical protein